MLACPAMSRSTGNAAAWTSTKAPPADLAEDDLARYMAAYQGGQFAAFEALYRHLSAPLRRYLAALCRDSALAEDLLQETFLQFHRSRQTFTPDHAVRAWAFGIARHVFLMDRRSSVRRQRREQDKALEFEEWMMPNSLGGFIARDRLRPLIATLSPGQREPLLLHHVWGFSFEEIAGILGIRTGAAKVRAHRAMQQLRRLAEEGS